MNKRNIFYSVISTGMCGLFLSACAQPAPMAAPSASSVESAAPGVQIATVSSAQEFGLFVFEEGFTSQPIPTEVQQGMLGKSYPAGCDVPFEELRYLQMNYVGFDNIAHEGEMIVNKSIAGDVLEIFMELFKAEYPIEKMVLVDVYNADDEASMADNNTSGFCFRLIEGTAKRSFHADGLAIDINPLYNPYVKGNYVGPAAGAPYVDRTLDNPYYITAESLPYKLFTAHGFGWGGDWDNVKDYQHFSLGE